MKIIKYLFMAYVICLSVYASYKNLLKLNYGSQKVSWTEPQKDCFKVGEDWRYCVYSDALTDHSAYLYAFHDEDEDENFWVDPSSYPALLNQYWQKKSLKKPKVIAVSFGSSWIVSPHISRAETGLLERFQREVFPVIEQALGVPQKRFLMGASRGALSAAVIALAMPKNFSRVALLCPPFYKLSPYASWKAWMQFVMRTGASPQEVLAAVAFRRSLFANDEEWRFFSPLMQVDNTSFLPHHRFYVSAGLKNQRGLFEGALEFVTKLENLAVSTEWRPHSGGRCAVDVASVGAFFQL